MIYLLLTLDYEVFGNGAGDVMRDVIEPTRRLLNICDEHGAKMTIMFEVGEYWAFEQHDSKLHKDLGYSPSQQMKAQAIDAIKRGHDVQLHLHPQWIGADYFQGGWQLCHSCWRLADLPGRLGDRDQIKSITGALYAGKQTLESMIRPIAANYDCRAFRAGGFYAQPSEDIIAAMREVGLHVDSSVVRGYKTCEPFAVDYSQMAIDKSSWWTSRTELIHEGRVGENVLELPVSARMQPYWKNFKMTKFCAAVRRRQAERRSGIRQEANTRLSSVPKYTTVLKKLLGKHANTFDYCKLSTKDMLNRLKENDREAERAIVLIGHSKDFFNDRHFDRFLATIREDKNVSFQTISEFTRAKLQTKCSRPVDEPHSLARML